MNKVEFTIDDIFGDSLNLKLEEGTFENKEEVVNEIAKLVKVREDGIYILDDNLLATIAKKNLSASMVSSLLQCPADWMMDNFILTKIDHEEPVHFLRGHLFHKTMEKFFALPKEQRNPKVLGQAAMHVINTEYKEVLEDIETMNWLKEALKGYLDTGFEYANIDLAQIPKEPGKEPEIGIEMFVKGKLGNTTREVVGFIDRLDQLPNGSLQIVDYKTGKKMHPFDPSKPIDSHNDFGYWRQQLAYTMLLEQQGHYVGGAKLEFPIAKGEVVVDVRNEHLRKQVEKDFELTDATLNKCIEERFFPFHGHFFCKWCGMLSPNYTPSRYGKLNVSWEEVNQYVELLK